MRINELLINSQPLLFETIELDDTSLFKYIQERWFNCNNIDAYLQWSPGIFAQGLKRHLLENDGTAAIEITPFINQLSSADYKNTIKPGDSFAVLEFDFGFGWREIVVRGFTTPKIVARIELNKRGEINRIYFENGSFYPRFAPANYGRRPTSYAVYFENKHDAEIVRTYANVAIPSTWAIQFALDDD